MTSPKPQQILHLTPESEILFEGPFDKVVTSYLEISNPSNEKVCFKVKTTAPRRYCVRPNSGIVTPGSKMRIAIMLQPIEQESQSERNRHKFMVQSAIVSNDDASLEEIWKTITQEDIMDSKLRCVFQARNEGSQSSDNDLASSQQSDRTSHKTGNKATAEPKLADDAQPDLVKPNNQKSSNAIAVAASVASDTGVSVSQIKSKPNKPAGDVFTRSLEQPITSTPTRPSRYAAANVSSTSSPIEQQKNLANRSELRSSDKSIASSHNLTSSFLQPMSNDHKVVLVSLIMLILGVILGKYII